MKSIINPKAKRFLMAGEMACKQKVLDAKPDRLSLNPGTHGKGENQCPQVDLHTCVVAYTHPHI